MLPIFFVAYAFIYQLPTTSGDRNLNYYDAKGELKIIQEWYNLVKSPLDETKALDELKKEAKSEAGKQGTQMNDFLTDAFAKRKKCAQVKTLPQAECLVVMMYTNKFYIEYNQASTNRNWKPYRVYTTLLMSALKKLAGIYPLPPGTTVYRGIKVKANSPPTGSRLFWKAFTSTSLNYEIAKEYAGEDGTILEFQLPDSRYAAKVDKLSNFPQEEVLLLPFEAFDFVKADNKGIHFKTSKTQELLK